MNAARRQALGLSIFTVGYNLAEGTIAMIASSLAGSSALLGFGFDSFIESLSGMVMIWRFWNFDIDSGEEEFEDIERRSARLVACSFFVLGAYVIFEAVRALVRKEVPETSMIGIALAVSSLIVMPILFRLKYRLGTTIGSKSLIADSKETLACLFLSAALLAGLAAFYFWRLWWIDSACALVIAMLLLKEGFCTLQESHE